MANEKNLTPFSDPDVARAAARKSAEVRRANKLARAQAKAIADRDLQDWIGLYKREDLADACAAAAQKVAHMILGGEITDQRALVQALPVLVDIARIEQGLHTTATMHATVTSSDALARLTSLREQAADRSLVVDVTHRPDTPPAD